MEYIVFDLEQGLGEVFKNALTQALLDSTSSYVSIILWASHLQEAL